jgi:uncharacterized membrane protein YphA (DoxX/SURF4 family)
MMNVIGIYAIFSLRALLAVLLITAGAAKLADIRGFTTTLQALGVSVHSENVLRSTAFSIALIEVVVGLASIAGFLQSVINGLVLLLVVGFMLIVIFALRKAPYITCRCFGALSDSQFSAWSLVRNVLFVLGAIVVFWWGLAAPPVQFHVSFGSALLLILGYLVFAFGVAQAATIIALVKARMSR